MDPPRRAVPRLDAEAARRREPQGLSVLNNRQLAADLCALSPALRELQRAHIEAHGALLPHVFMESVLAHVGTCLESDYREPPGSFAGEIDAILACLEAAMAQGDRETRSAVALSFARDAELERFFIHLEPRLGPRLRAQLHHA